jgi:hypothetical protein
MLQPKEAGPPHSCIHALAVAGIVSPKLTQAYFGELRGGQALADIAPGEVFVTVPRGAALVVAPNERCPCPDFVDPGDPLLGFGINHPVLHPAVFRPVHGQHGKPVPSGGTFSGSCCSPSSGSQDVDPLRLAAASPLQHSTRNPRGSSRWGFCCSGSGQRGGTARFGDTLSSCRAASTRLCAGRKASWRSCSTLLPSKRYCRMYFRDSVRAFHHSMEVGDCHAGSAA